MLILSRRPSETIRFPQLGISVTIVSVKGNRVQVGIDAPADIQILRKELEPKVDASSTTQNPTSMQNVDSLKIQRSAAQERHDFRNRLNRATLGLHLAQKQLAAGQATAADDSLSNALARLMELEKEISSSSKGEMNPASEVSNSTSDHLQNSARPSSSVRSTASIDVLLVEDDQNEQALLRTLLEMEGYRVHTASNGIEAMQCLERFTPQCVLLDMLMPDCDGPETLGRLRASPTCGGLPVFAVSGTSPESVGLSVGADGVDEWFPKPLNASILVKRMRDRIASLCS